MKNTKINAFVIGAGRQFENFLLPAMLEDPKIRLKGLCDPNPQKRALASPTTSNAAKFFSNIEELLAFKEKSGSSLSLFIISTPPDSHASLAKKCIPFADYVYIDKPLSTNYQEGKKILELAKKNGSVIAVGSQRRYEATYTTVFQKIQELGPLRRVYFHSHGNFLGSSGESEEDDIFNGAGFHLIDTIQWLISSNVSKVRFSCHYSSIINWPNRSGRAMGFDAMFKCSNESENFPLVLSSSMLPPPNTVDELLVINGLNGEIRLTRTQAPRSMKAAEVCKWAWNWDKKSLEASDISPKNAEARRDAPLKQLIEMATCGNTCSHTSPGSSALVTLKIIQGIKQKNANLV